MYYTSIGYRRIVHPPLDSSNITGHDEFVYYAAHEMIKSLQLMYILTHVRIPIRI